MTGMEVRDALKAMIEGEDADSTPLDGAYANTFEQEKVLLGYEGLVVHTPDGGVFYIEINKML